MTDPLVIQARKHCSETTWLKPVAKARNLILERDTYDLIQKMADRIEQLEVELEHEKRKALDWSKIADKMTRALDRERARNTLHKGGDMTPGEYKRLRRDMRISQGLDPDGGFDGPTGAD